MMLTAPNILGQAMLVASTGAVSLSNDKHGAYLLNHKRGT